MADPIAAAYSRLFDLHQEAGQIVAWLDAHRQLSEGVGTIPAFLSDRRSGEPAAPTVETTSPTVSSSAKAACLHVAGEGQERSASASPSIPAGAAAKLDKAVRVARERLAKPTAAAKRGLPENVYAQGGRFLAKVTVEENRKLHVGSFKTVEAAQAAVADFKSEVARRASQNSPLDKPSGAQNVGPADANSGKGSDARAGQDGADIAPAQSDQCVTVTGAGEGTATPVDPAPVPDTNSAASPSSQLHSSDVEKDGASASSPSLGVSSLDLPAPASLGTAPAFSERRARVIEVPESERRVPRHIEPERPLPITGASRSKPSAQVAAAPPRPKISGAIHLIPIGCIAVDDVAKVIAGPGGEWATYSSAVSILKRLAALKPGQMLDAETLSKDLMAKSRFLESVGTWARELADIGIELGRRGELFWLTTMKVAA